MVTVRDGRCARHCTSCSSPSWLTVGSSVMEEREMGAGAISRLETDPNLQRHSKGRFWCSEGMQPGIKDAGSQPGCWAAVSVTWGRPGAGNEVIPAQRSPSRAALLVLLSQCPLSLCLCCGTHSHPDWPASPLVEQHNCEGIPSVPVTAVVDQGCQQGAPCSCHSPWLPSERPTGSSCWPEQC